MTEKRLCIVEGCDYCPYFEDVYTKERHKNNPLLDGDFYKCNKLQICVRNNLDVDNPKKHLFSFCPLEKVEE